MASSIGSPRARARASGDGELGKPRLDRVWGRDGAGRGVRLGDDLKMVALRCEVAGNGDGDNGDAVARYRYGKSDHGDATSRYRDGERY